jgi:hypothetical protein
MYSLLSLFYISALEALEKSRKFKCNVKTGVQVRCSPTLSGRLTGEPLINIKRIDEG